MIAMILILLALFVTAGIAVFLLFYADASSSPGIAVFGCAIAITAAVGGIVYSDMAWSWFASEYKANIINREYGTNYSREEVFFASDVIDTIRELDRKRIEVNGDLLTGKERAK